MGLNAEAPQDSVLEGWTRDLSVKSGFLPRPVRTWIWPIAALVSVLTIWQAVCVLLDVPEYVLPSPLRIASEINANLADLLRHSGITFGEAAAGFMLANLLSFFFAILFCYSPFFQKSTYPYMIALQSVPIVALAPLITLWFGEGWVGKVIMAALISFFPMVVNATQGLKLVDPLALDVMRSLSATQRQILLKLRVPNALPYVLSALKISAPLAIVGALVAELTAASSGIGYLILVAAYRVQTPYLFACVVFAALGGLAFFGMAILIETLYKKRVDAEIVPPDRLMEYLREGLELSEGTASSINRHRGAFEKLRAAVHWPDDAPHIARLTQSEKPRLRHLGYALCHKPIREGDQTALQILLDAWRRAEDLGESERFQERMQAMWQILDADGLSDEWHCELYRFVRRDWDYWRRRTLEWTGQGDKNTLLQNVKSRLTDTDYPSTKGWAYLLQASLSSQEGEVRELARKYMDHSHFLVRAVAMALVASPAGAIGSGAFLGPDVTGICPHTN